MKPSLLAVVSAVMAGWFSAGQCESYPERPVRLITPAAPGASNDALARAVAAKLSELLGQNVVVENRPGGGFTIASAAAVKATPDGHTLLHCGIWDAIAPKLHQRLPFAFLRDFTPISLFGTTANVLVVHPSVPVRSVQELIAYAQANPGKMSYASGGIGTSTHLSMELFKSLTSTDLMHVPYKGGPLLMADLLAGRVSAMMSNLPAQIDNVKSGKLRGLAVSTLKRSSRLPQLPTVAESGLPGFDVTVWHGLCAPAATPDAVIARLNAEVAKAVSSSDLRNRLEKMGVDPQSSTAEHFVGFFQSETRRWAKVINDAGIPAQ